MCPQNLCPKKIWSKIYLGRMKFELKKVMGPKKFVGPNKNPVYSAQLGIFGSKIIFGPNNVGSQKLLSKKISKPKKFDV